MVKTAESGASGSRHSNLKKSFRKCLHLLLTEFSFEDFSRAFPKFTGAEQERLYHLYVQVITSIVENLQDDFNLVCHDTQVGAVLDTVEHNVEQQSLDPLWSQKTNLRHLKHDLLASKKDEVWALEQSLKKVEDEKHIIKAQIKLLKKKCEDASVITEAVKELRSVMVKFGSYNDEVV